MTDWTPANESGLSPEVDPGPMRFDSSLFWMRFGLLWFCPGLVFRLFVLAGMTEESIGDRLLAILSGFVSDLQALWLVFGWLALGFLAGARFARWWLGLTLASVVIVFIADLTYWSEFHARFDRFVLHYAEYPREVAVFLNEQFYLLLFALPFAGAIWLVARWMTGWLPEVFSVRDRLTCVAWIVLGVGVAAVGGPGTPGHSRYLHHVGSNGYLGALMAARVDESVWRGVYWQPGADSVAAERARGKADPAADAAYTGEGGGVTRSAFAAGRQFRHLVLVIEESFGGEYWRDPKKRALYMPELQSLARRGLSFESVYATGGFTIRGLEAILNGYPPLPGVVVTTEPGLERLPSLPREMGRAGFHSVFVYGGWPGFTSFHDYWRRIGYDEMLSRFDFDNRWFETSWGVADEILFDKVLEEMDRLTGEFDRVMLTTLTVSNHRPFDFPDGRIRFPSDERRREYVIAYADWALGQFFRKAQAHPWFEDTLFVVAADHGPEHEGPALVPAGGFRVPLVLYNPSKLSPAVIGYHGSIMSLPATLFDLMDVTPVEPFFGRNLLTGDGLVPVELHHEIGLLGRDRLTVLVRNGGVLGWRFDGARLLPDEPDFEQAATAAALFGRAHQRLYGG